jgi:hypothetical protein
MLLKGLVSHQKVHNLGRSGITVCANPQGADQDMSDPELLQATRRDSHCVQDPWRNDTIEQPDIGRM